MIFLYLSHYLLGGELLVVVNEDCCASKPLSVELTPYSLAPSCIGYGEVDAIGIEVVPEYTCGEMAQSIQMIVSHHLWFATCAAGEIHQHSIFVGVYMLRTTEDRSLRPLIVPAMEAIRNRCALLSIRVYCYEYLYRRTLVHRSDNLRCNIFVVHADDSLHACTVVAINDVVLGEHVGGRNSHSTNLA